MNDNPPTAIFFLRPRICFSQFLNCFDDEDLYSTVRSCSIVQSEKRMGSCYKVEGVGGWGAPHVHDYRK